LPTARLLDQERFNFMNLTDIRRLSIIRVYLYLSCLCYLFVFWVRLPAAYGIGRILGFSGILLVKLLPMFAGFGASAAMLWLSYSKQRSRLLHWAEAIRSWLPEQAVISIILFVLPMVIYPALRLSSYAKTVDVYLPTWWLFGHFILFGSLIAYSFKRNLPLLANLAITALLYGVAYQVFIASRDVSTYPLSMGWSEASRYYNASLFFARKIYGTSLPLPTLHPSRYMMQAIPFLISGLPLWFHRLWQVLLWLGFTWAGSAALVRRLKLDSRLTGLLVTAWGFLFLYQGPIYYHLMLAAIIVLLGFNSRRPWRSFLVVLLASVWAGLSRINWFPVPGFLAVVLYILETPLNGKTWWRYWLWPAVWVAVGFLAAYATSELYIVLSLNPPEVFGSSLSSPLLWYRLWPNSTYSPGILLGLAWAIFPVAAILLSGFIPQVKAWHWMRSAALAMILGVFLVGGVVVSVKIGGGSNLHNLDAFLILLFVIAGYIYYRRFIPDYPQAASSFKVSTAWIALALVIPLIPLAIFKFATYQIQPGYAQQLNELQQILDTTHQQDSSVLFIAQRLLVTFGTVKNVKMEPEHERVFLMEMAMAYNQDYLQGFEQDLKTHKYSYIIFEPLTGGLQTPETDFAEENNAFVVRATGPILNYYKVLTTYKALDIAVLEPCEPVGCGVNH
jgi:hypothetical protein